MTDLTNIEDLQSAVSYASVNVSTGDNTLVAAVSGKKICLLACSLSASAAGAIRFEDGAGGTALSGVIPLAASQQFLLPFSPSGWFETTANTLLNLEVTTADIDGFIVYIEV